MSVDRIHGEIVFTCDATGCDDELETGTENWTEARDELKGAGWATAKDGDEWVHRCPTCQPRGWREELDG